MSWVKHTAVSGMGAGGEKELNAEARRTKEVRGGRIYEIGSSFMDTSHWPVPTPEHLRDPHVYLRASACGFFTDHPGIPGSTRNGFTAETPRCGYTRYTSKT